IADHYQARRTALETGQGASGVPYKPAPPDRLYLSREQWSAQLAGESVARVSPFALPDAANVIALAARRGRNFAPERNAADVNVFDALIGHIDGLAKAGKRVVLACCSEGSRDRMGQVLVDHGLTRVKPVADWTVARSLAAAEVGLAVIGLEDGFETDDVAVIGEQDVLGDRLVRPHGRTRRAADYLTDVTGLAEGDIVVHIDHGIGRFVGLKTIEAAGAPHDCLEIHYAGGGRLFLPLENLELLWPYGSGGRA